MASERNEQDAAERRDESAREQEGSYKVHGDKLEPIIPRGADQKGDADEEAMARRPAHDDDR